VLAIEQRLVDASTAPVQKKKRVASQQATGTHLADGTVGGRLKGSAVDAMQSSPAQASEPVQSRQPIVPKPERIASPEPIREVRQKRRQRKEEVYDSDSDQATYPIRQILKVITELNLRHSTPEPELFSPKSHLLWGRIKSERRKRILHRSKPEKCCPILRTAP
jgi:hypothetical protein